jgi:mRNA export factor
MFDVSSGQATQVAQHEAPIKTVKWVDAQNGILATGSWDKTLKVRFIFFPPPIPVNRLLPVLGPS